MNIPEILSRKYPGTQWTLTGSEYAGLEWLDQSPKPTEDELAAQSAVVDYEIAYEAVQHARQQAYRDESDPLFFYAERGKGQKQAWIDKVAEIDARLPYPEKPNGK